MKVNGWYYSHALLSAILAHSARWCRLDPNVAEALRLYENGGLFFEHSRTVLHDDLREGRTGIPTVQALLLVSAQECGKGNWTQAWMYSGIAFRLLGDLGINVDGRKYMRAVNFSEEDIEIRNRLFWSCYFWDKIISLYLGRCPQIQYSNVCPPQLMMDDSAEYELWSPQSASGMKQTDYPLTPAHAISSFIWVCKLSQVLNEVLVQVYDPMRHAPDGMFECIKKQKQALCQWRSALPDFLRLDIGNLPMHCPPSHIVTLKYLRLAFERGLQLLQDELNKLGINIDADFDLQGTGTPGKKFSMPRETPVPAMLAPVPDPSSEPAPFEFCSFGPGDPLNAASFCPN
ncbi:MAG: hypothetical protein Q9162_006454 [Coniocarpon cinnabarinum]